MAQPITYCAKTAKMLRTEQGAESKESSTYPKKGAVRE
jgi:hypothetical protein